MCSVKVVCFGALYVSTMICGSPGLEYIGFSFSLTLFGACPLDLDLNKLKRRLGLYDLMPVSVLRAMDTCLLI